MVQATIKIAGLDSTDTVTCGALEWVTKIRPRLEAAGHTVISVEAPDGEVEFAGVVTQLRDMIPDLTDLKALLPKLRKLAANVKDA